MYTVYQPYVRQVFYTVGTIVSPYLSAFEFRVVMFEPTTTDGRGYMGHSKLFNLTMSIYTTLQSIGLIRAERLCCGTMQNLIGSPSSSIPRPLAYQKLLKPGLPSAVLNRTKDCPELISRVNMM